MANNLNTYTPQSVSIPGTTIKDLMVESGMTPKELAGKMKITSKALNAIIKGDNPITQEVAATLEKILKTPAAFWLSRERQYRDFLSRQDKTKKSKEERPMVVGNVLKKTA